MRLSLIASLSSKHCRLSPRKPSSRTAVSSSRTAAMPLCGSTPAKPMKRGPCLPQNAATSSFFTFRPKVVWLSRAFTTTCFAPSFS